MEEPGRFTLYTDASVKGRFLAKGTRSQRGPALGAWCGWDCEDRSARPCVIGVAFLGDNHGPNSAEYAALIKGLDATLLHLRMADHSIGEVAAYTDSSFIVKQLRGQIAVNRLRNWYMRANELLDDLLNEAGIHDVRIEEAPSRHPCIRQTHSLTRRAWDVVLHEKHWRPESRWREPVDADDDIPF